MVQRSVGVVGAALGQQIVGDLVAGDPHVVLACQVDLINRSVLFTPFVKLHPTVLLGHFMYATNDR